MNSDSAFGAEPDQLQRLFEIGLDKTDLDEDTPPIARWDLLKEMPGSRIGPYQLTRILGEGGMGLVYLAQQEHPIRRHVALKVIKPGMDSARAITRFEAERQALALLDHPNIAHVLDAGTTEAGRVRYLAQGLPRYVRRGIGEVSREDQAAIDLHKCRLRRPSPRSGRQSGFRD